MIKRAIRSGSAASHLEREDRCDGMQWCVVERSLSTTRVVVSTESQRSTMRNIMELERRQEHEGRHRYRYEVARSLQDTSTPSIKLLQAFTVQKSSLASKMPIHIAEWRPPLRSYLVGYTTSTAITITTSSSDTPPPHLILLDG